MYNQILPPPDWKLQKLAHKWAGEVGTMSTKELAKKIFDGKHVTPIVKYQSFQYRHAVRAIITNIHLKHWGLREDDDCSFCESSRETVQHLLHDCQEIQGIWRAAGELCKAITGMESGTPSSYSNCVFLECCIVKQCQNQEKYYAIKENKLVQYAKRWKEDIPMLNVTEKYLANLDQLIHASKLI